MRAVWGRPEREFVARRAVAALEFDARRERHDLRRVRVGLPGLNLDPEATKRIVDRKSRRKRLSAADVVGASFDRSGDQVVTSGYDLAARVLDVATERETATLRGHREVVMHASFSLDSK